MQRDTVDAEYVGDTRFNIWKLCLTELSSRPILGFGYGAFWTKEREMEIRDSFGFTVTQSHCGYIQIALDAGLIGLIGVVTTFTLALTKYIRTYNVDTR